MGSEHLERVAAIAHPDSPTGVNPLKAPVVPVESMPPADLQAAIASAVHHGEPVAVVAATADVPALVVLDALDALEPHAGHTAHDTHEAARTLDALGSRNGPGAHEG